ncbi:MAG TPA: cell division protein FtsL [Chromatiales bacterium]|nr:cell division protein FtsL [Chromatiales bacterium]
MSSSLRGALIFCVVLALVSAIGVVYAKFASRKLFVELQGIRADREAVDVEWGRLQIEQGTLATHGKVETLARSRLGMHIPAPKDIRVVKP